MKAIKSTFLATAIFICLLGLSANLAYGQNTMPEALDSGTLEEQMEYLQERTRIYQDFRAIREDMFQKIKTNSLDSLKAAKINIIQLETELQEHSDRIDSLLMNLRQTNANLDEAIKNRDRFSFIGLPVHKALYNTIMWIAIAGLVILSIVLFLTAKRNVYATKRTRKDLEEITEEFETHRKQTRERQEQLVVKHHNELRKLKG